MIVSKKHKALILKLKDPNRVTTVIPGAKIIDHKGNKLVAVRHRVDEVKILRNLGIDAPSPIQFYYDWPARFKPFDAQREQAAFMTLNGRAFNLSEMGVGKTMATLWAYDYLRSLGKYHKVVVISPLSTLERTWADEVFNHFPHLTTAVLYGSRDRRLKMLSTDADIYLINHDGIKVAGLAEEIAAREDIDLIVIDELSQVARNSGTDRFKALRTIVKGRDAWGLTGTPTPNAPTDAWAQCRLMVPDRVPPYFGRFKDQTMRQVTNFVWVPRNNAMDIVHEAMQPAIRFMRSECMDLPPCLFQTREAALTTKQTRAYKDMLSKLKAELDSGDVTAVNEAVKAQKLIQIACGLVYGADGEHLEIDAGPRLETVREIVEEAGQKVLVFVPFVGVIDRVAEHLRAASITCEIIHGGIGKSERDRIIRAFQREAAPRVLVCQPACLSHGVTLTAASTIIWYAPITSADTYEQANARIVRPGQKFSQLIVHLEGTEIERRYYQRLRDKQKLQGILLDLVKDGRVPA
jgi:SNF2 family DNA or RNA helicase